MDAGKERFILQSVIVVSICALVIFLLTQSESDSFSNQVSEDHATSDVSPSTDIETLPPILRNRAARKRVGESAGSSGESIQPPVELELSLLSVRELEEGGEAIVELSVEPVIEVPGVRWQVEIPEGLKLKSGRRSWEGNLSIHEEKSFFLTLSVPDRKEYELYCRVETTLANGDSLRQGKTLRINLGREDEETSSFKRVGADGRSVTSYRGKSGEEGD